jgi:peptide/nickel transport system permease protein
MDVGDKLAPPAQITQRSTTTVSETPRPSGWQYRLRRLRKYPLAVFGTVVLITLALIAIFADVLAPYDPLSTSLNVLAPPNAEHLLGTDDVGRDVLSRLIYAARVSLTVGVVSTVITVVIGLLLGVLSGFFGPRVDVPISSFTNIMLSIPIFPLALVLGAFLDMTLGTIVLIIGFLSWMSVARIVRAEVLSLRERDFIEAAHCVGASSTRIIFVHIVPNITNALIVAATLLVANAILLEAALSYLGYGIQPPTPSWGNMLMDAQRYLRTYPGLAIYPGLLISLTVISINFLGDGLRDALDPRMGEG